MKDRIRTFQDLKTKQDSLRLQADVSKNLFFESLGTTRRTATHFLTNKIFLPAGITGAVAWGASKLFSEKDKKENKRPRIASARAQFLNPKSPVYKLIQQLLPLGTKLLMAYMGKKAVEEVAQP